MPPRAYLYSDSRQGSWSQEQNRGAG
jgi:hypothetical protein